MHRRAAAHGLGGTVDQSPPKSGGTCFRAHATAASLTTVTISAIDRNRRPKEVDLRHHLAGLVRIPEIQSYPAI
jgi:hypothetical protein